MHRTLILSKLTIMLALLMLAGAPLDITSAVMNTGAKISSELPVVARITFHTQEELFFLAEVVDIWQVNHAEGWLQAMLAPEQVLLLQGEGFSLTIDDEETARVQAAQTAWEQGTATAQPEGADGIPGFACYRTVEETYASLANLAIARPTLARWIDIGDSWEKVTAGGQPGYDIPALVLTNQATPGPKPDFLLLGATHARELVTAETATRFAEYLVANYDKDPNITWLLDTFEVHVVPVHNPDGRKMAESGLYWRKNTDNNDGCNNPEYWGTDLNRNSSFHWGGPGSTNWACGETFRGLAPLSEPETQAIQAYMASIFPDRRGLLITDAAPLDTDGLFITLHSFGELVLWPWGDTSTPAPNAAGLQTLGRKMASYTGYVPGQSITLYPTSGTTDDWAYGELGLPAYTFEMGTYFFQDCASFESTIYPDNLQALLYALKSTRWPYRSPAGPDSLDLKLETNSVLQSTPLAVSGWADDTRSSAGEPAQAIRAVRYSIDLPSWMPGVQLYSLLPQDGVFNDAREAFIGYVNTLELADGRHTLLVESQDALGNWGAASAVFFYTFEADQAAILQGSARDARTNAPVPAQITAPPYFTSSDPDTGRYILPVPGGTLPLSAQADSQDLAPLTFSGIETVPQETTYQDLIFQPICTLFFEDLENVDPGWSAETPWDITQEKAYSPTHAWSDSPGGSYLPGAHPILTSPELDLSGARSVNLYFRQWLDLGSGDAAYVDYSLDGGFTWRNAAGYQGSQRSWQQVNLELAELENQPQVYIRFRLVADSAGEGDGWYLDDIRLSGISQTCIPPLSPQATFTTHFGAASLGNPIEFLDLSRGSHPLEYAWDFGDGDISSLSNPAHTYIDTGIYTVTLTLSNSTGSSTYSGRVSIQPESYVALSSAQIQPVDLYRSGEKVVLQITLGPDNLTLLVQYRLNFGDGSQLVSGETSSASFTLEHIYAAYGVYPILLEAWNAPTDFPLVARLNLSIFRENYLPLIFR